MAEFFTDIEDFKNNGVGGGADMDEAFLVSIAQMIVHAKTKHLTPWLGEKTLTTLSALYPDAAVNSKAAQLTRLIQSSLAWLALYENSFSQIRWNESGPVMGKDTPYKYVMAESREKYLEIGFENLETTLLFLDQNLTDFPDWAISTARAKHKAVFLNTAAAFRTAYSTQITRYTFQILRGIIEDVEYQCLERILPARFFFDLKTKFKADANMTSDAERELLYLIQKAVAFFVIEEAMHRHFVQVQDGEITQVSAVQDQYSKTKKTPSRNDMENAAFHIDVWANAAMNRLKAYLIAHVSDFPLCFSTDYAGGTNPDADAWFKVVKELPPQYSESRGRAAIL